MGVRPERVRVERAAQRRQRAAGRGGTPRSTWAPQLEVRVKLESGEAILEPAGQRIRPRIGWRGTRPQGLPTQAGSAVCVLRTRGLRDVRGLGGVHEPVGLRIDARFPAAARPVRLGAGLAFPASLVVLLIIMVPLLQLVRYSFNHFDPVEMMQQAVTLENYAKFSPTRTTAMFFLTTVGVAALCTVLALVLGFPVAYFLARTDSRYKSLLVILLVFP